MDASNTIRITATLPETYLSELKELAKSKKIPSVNFGIKEAVLEYLNQYKKAEYDAQMMEAAKDPAFLERTYKCAEDFKYCDSEVQGTW